MPPPAADNPQRPLPQQRRSATRLLRSLLLPALLAGAAWWAWQQPFLDYPRTLWELSRMAPAYSLPVPVEGVSVDRIADTWGAGRGERRHEGTDIFGRRGTPVRASTAGIVSAIRTTGRGGRQVWVRGPGLERHYYAHLDGWAADLAEGDVVAAGDVLGYVGDTGNARGTPPHLHYGIYAKGGAIDPLPRLREGARATSPDATSSR